MEWNWHRSFGRHFHSSPKACTITSPSWKACMCVRAKSETLWHAPRSFHHAAFRAAAAPLHQCEPLLQSCGLWKGGGWGHAQRRR